MKTIYRFFFIIITTAVACFQNAKATHVAGADITYEHIGADSFLVTINIFDDCGTTANVLSPITVYFTNSCGLPFFDVPFNEISSTEVSQLCPSEQPNSTCNGGNLPGMLQRVFQGIVVLDSCDSWTITWGIANRNASVNLDPPGNTYYFAVDASLNSADAPSNNSPEFNAQPIPYVCANQIVNYSFGVSEIDGDSLVYSFTDPLGGAQGAITPLTYQPGYTVQQPIPGIVLNPQTGLLVFTPTILGGFVVAVKVEEYRNGVLIGFVKRDIQFIVRSCTNIAPDLLAGQITNLTGNAVQIDPFTIEMCEGNTFTFSSVYTDQDINDTLDIITNIVTVLPGSLVSTSGTNPLTVQISWTAPAGSSGQNNSFAITVNDGACPIPGFQNFVYNIDVVPSTFIIPSAAVLCGNDSVQLQAIGGADFIWYDLSGNQIVPNPEFSCNNCPNPVAKPITTTSYVVESNLSSTCVNRDTIVVSIAPDYSILASISDSLICAGEQVQVNVLTTNLGAPYTYSWTPANLFTNPITDSTTAIFPNPGTFNAIINVTSVQGCLRSDTVAVVVVPAPVFNIQQYGPYCNNASVVNLDYTVVNPNYLENWQGNGVIDSLTGNFNPSLANIGANNITLTLSVPGGTCTATQSTTINIINAPDASLTITDSVFCSTDSSIQLTTITPGGLWTSNPLGAISSDIFNPALSPIGFVDLIYSFSGTCPDADTVSVLVNLTPQPPILTQSQTFCAGLLLPIGTITATGVTGGIISWFGNDLLQGLINTGVNFEGELTNNTNVYAYDSINGCISNQSSLAVNFYPTPTAQFTVDPIDGVGTTPLLVNFLNGSTGYSEWQWSFGDSSSIDSINFNATHTYPEGGIFRVLLTVDNNFGCSDTLGFTVLALEELVIPNIFTPNGDGSNDEFYFKIDPNSVKTFKATIFDRWGKKVTEFASVKDKWDGGNFPAGTYYYIIEASDLNNQPFKHTHGFFKMMK
jgi:gliding motility-associated-like protein